jgi:competence protein ComEA
MNQIVEDVRARVADWRNDLHFSQAQRRSLLILFLVILLASAAIVIRGSSTQIVAPIPAPLVITPANITVDVAGAVAKPGVYALAEDSRVIDAIAAAGGANTGTDLSDINLARIIKDGEQIYVEPVVTQGKPQISAPRPRASSGPININRASEKEFDSLPGIGPVIAARIIAYRKANGPFSIVDDLQKVSGIGSAKFAQLKNKIKV